MKREEELDLEILIDKVSMVLDKDITAATRRILTKFKERAEKRIGKKTR